MLSQIYRQVSNIRHTLVCYEIVDHSDVVGASPVGAAPTNLHSQLNTWLHWIGQRHLQDETRNVYVWGFGAPYIRDFTVFCHMASLGLNGLISYLLICWWLGNSRSLGAVSKLSVWKCHLASAGIPIVKIRWSWYHVALIMGNLISDKTIFVWKRAPGHHAELVNIGLGYRLMLSGSKP